jgi:predicted nucleotidyltransferase
MKTVGIIVEYNPFHNGHLYHIKETRRKSNCDVLICVMSGNFTQRGEPAITDKFTRTKMALENHADLVVELPFVFTVQNADIFAKTSVSILNHLGVDEIYFGSENASIEELEAIGSVMHEDSYNNLVKQYLNDGNSYPTASDLAMKEVCPNEYFHLPNNILGIQYIIAGKELNSPITFHTIQRTGTNYYDEIKDNTPIQSATSIRKHLLRNETIDSYVPQNVSVILKNVNTVTFNAFSREFKYLLSVKSKEELESIFSVTEGFENRLLKIKNFIDVDDLINQLLTRRYTNAKIKRMLTHILCDTKKSLLISFEVPYIRILGMNDSGKNYLHQIKKEISIPLISKVKEGIHPYLDHELQVSKIYSLGLKKDIFKQEFERLIY